MANWHHRGKTFEEKPVTGKVTEYDGTKYIIEYDDKRTETLPEYSVTDIRKKNADWFPNGTFIVKPTPDFLNLAGTTVYNEMTERYNINYWFVREGLTCQEVLELLETRDNANDERVSKTRDNADDAMTVSDDDHEHDNSLPANQKVRNKNESTKTATIRRRQQDNGTAFVIDEDKCYGIDVNMNIKDFTNKCSNVKLHLNDGTIVLKVEVDQEENYDLDI